MKTALQIKQEKMQLLEEAAQHRKEGEKSAASRKIKRAKWLDLAISYAETMPDSSYLKQQVIMVQKRIEMAEKRIFHEVVTPGVDPYNQEVKKKLKNAEKAEGVLKMKEQIKFMRYINS